MHKKSLIEKIIENAVFETFRQYGKEKVTKAILHKIQQNDNKDFYGEYWREYLQKYISKEIMLDKIIQKYVTYIVDTRENQFTLLDSLGNATWETFNKYKTKSYEYGIDVACYAIRDYILHGKNHFTRDNQARKILTESNPTNNDVINQIIIGALRQITIEKTKEKIDKIDKFDIERLSIKKYTVDNLKVIPETLENCKPAILEESDFEGIEQGTILTSKTGQNNELAVSGSTGLERKGQEDSAVVIVHPNNPDLKMLVVADGCGGVNEGEKASKMAVEGMKEWFESPETLRYFESFNEIDEELQINLQRVNEAICRECTKSGTTLTAAIVGKNNTHLINIGDSRAYTIKGSDIKQITKDQSVCYLLYRQGQIAYKDDIRFHIRNNMILNSIGADIQDTIRFDSYDLNNNDYDILILNTDGISDEISDPTIMKIATHGRTAEEISGLIVKAALNQENPDLILSKRLNGNPEYRAKEPGSDNATIAVFDNRNKGGREDER